jgi:hypothetical protein
MIEVLVKRTARVKRPAREAISFLQDVATLEWYEPKVDLISVRRYTPQSGEYWIKGHFVGLPWSGGFSYTLHRCGFRSEMTKAPRGVRLKGGFVVKPETPASCSVTHYERYQFSSWLLPLIPLIRFYLARSIKQEVSNVAKLIEEPPEVRRAFTARFIRRERKEEVCREQQSRH